MNKKLITAVCMAASVLLMAQTPLIQRNAQNFKTEGKVSKMSLTGKEFEFFNIVPCSPGNEELAAQDVIELKKRTGIDIALYSMTLHPEGKPAFRKVEYLTASFRKFRDALAGSGVHCGILVQSILGHWPRVDKNEEPWQRSVDINGEQTRFCVLDPGYRKYIFDTAAYLAKEKPFFIMTDDDVRSFQKGTANCFCPLHTAMFNKLTGKNWTSEQYRNAVKKCAFGDDIYKAYMEVRNTHMDGVVELIRKGLDSVDPSIQAGFCMSYAERQFAKGSAKVIAAKGQPPVLRVANGSYMRSSIKGLGTIILLNQGYYAFNKEIPILLDESDTCPHTRYSMTASELHIKLCSAMLSGLTGSKLWHANCHKLKQPISRFYTDYLERYKDLYQTLPKIFRETKPAGTVIPVYAYDANWHPYRSQHMIFLPRKNWADDMLAVYGIPFQASDSLELDEIYTLYGADSVQRFSDDQLKKLMSRKLLVNGPAAVELTKRGFAKWTGVSAELKEFRYNRELSADGKQPYGISKNPQVPFLTVKDKKAEILTKLYYSPFSGAQDLEYAATGVVLYKNELGGTICTTAYHNDILWAWAYNARKSWLVKILEKMNGKLPYLVENDQWVALTQRKFADGADFLYIINTSFDPMESVQLHCAKVPEKVEILSDKGQWKPIPFTVQGDMITIQKRMECCTCAMFRIR